MSLPPVGRPRLFCLGGRCLIRCNRINSTGVGQAIPQKTLMFLDRLSPPGQPRYNEPHSIFRSSGRPSMKFRALSLATIAAAIFVMPASAHHSFAMFDATKEVTMSGTVKEFEWTNPHSWLRVMVNDQKTGKPVLWALELSSPSRLVTMGMRADSVKPGDAVSVTFHPMKNGSRGGQFLQAVLPGGKKIIRANARDENQ